MRFKNIKICDKCKVAKNICDKCGGTLAMKKKDELLFNQLISMKNDLEERISNLKNSPRLLEHYQQDLDFINKEIEECP